MTTTMTTMMMTTTTTTMRRVWQLDPLLSRERTERRPSRGGKGKEAVARRRLLLGRSAAVPTRTRRTSLKVSTSTSQIAPTGWSQRSIRPLTVFCDCNRNCSQTTTTTTTPRLPMAAEAVARLPRRPRDGRGLRGQQLRLALTIRQIMTRKSRGPRCGSRKKRWWRTQEMVAPSV